MRQIEEILVRELDDVGRMDDMIALGPARRHREGARPVSIAAHSRQHRSERSSIVDPQPWAD